MNYRIISSILGHVIMLESVLMLPSCLVGFLYGEQKDALIYLAVAVFCLLLGLIIRIPKPKSRTFYAKEGFITVSLSWIVMSLLGALPFYSKLYRCII